MVEDLVLTGCCLAGSTTAVPLQKQEAARDKFSKGTVFFCVLKALLIKFENFLFFY
jgi:hypothetical protein